MRFRTLIRRAKYAIEVFIVDVFIFFEVAILGHRALVGNTGYPAAVYDLLHDGGSFVACVYCYHLSFGEPFRHCFIKLMEHNAVVGVTGSYIVAQYKVVSVTGHSCHIGKLLLMFSLVKQSTFRVGGTDGYGFHLRSRLCAVVVFILPHWLLPMRRPVLVYLFIQLLLIAFG
jgi:hypothetical protein